MARTWMILSSTSKTIIGGVVAVFALLALGIACRNTDSYVYPTLFYWPIHCPPRLMVSIVMCAAFSLLWGWAVIYEKVGLDRLSISGLPLFALYAIQWTGLVDNSFWNLYVLSVAVGLSAYLIVRNFQKAPCLNWVGAWLIAGLLVVGFVVWTVHLQDYALKRFMLYYYDVGIYYKRIHNAIAYGSFHQVTSAHPPFFFHFSPALAIFIPVVYLFPSVEVLLVAQSFFMGITGLVLFAIAKDRGASPLTSLTCCTCFLLYPAVSQQTYNFGCGFHPLTMALPVVLAALYFIGKEKYLAGGLCVLFAVLTQEHVAVYFLGFGFILLFTKRHKIAGLVLDVFSLSYFFLATKWFMPRAESGDIHAVGLIWGHLGNSMFEILLSPIMRPEAFWTTLLQTSNIHLCLVMFFPVLFICFLRWQYIVALGPVFLFNFVRTDMLSKSISFQYHTLTVAFVFFALIFAITKKKDNVVFFVLDSCYVKFRKRMNLKAVLGACLFSCFLFSFFSGLLPWSRFANAMPLVNSPELMRRKHEAYQDLKKLIPLDKTVTCDDRSRILFLNHRLVMEPSDKRRLTTDYCVYQITGSDDRKKLYSDEIKRILKSGKYKLIYAKHGFYAFEHSDVLPKLLDDVF